MQRARATGWQLLTVATTLGALLLLAAVASPLVGRRTVLPGGGALRPALLPQSPSGDLAGTDRDDPPGLADALDLVANPGAPTPAPAGIGRAALRPAHPGLLCSAPPRGPPRA